MAAWVAAAVAVLAEVAYPLVHGQARDVLTVLTVVAFFLASAAHAVLVRGARFAALLVAVTAGGGLLVEAVGTHSGIPFGHYTYAHSLGAELLGVPVVIPLAWTMMAYPALLVGRRVSASPLLGPLAAGAALASWDLFLDPQMVDAGHWRWPDAGHVPTLVGIPVSNFAGWLATAVVMMLVLWWLPDPSRRRGVDDRLPLGLYLWTYASSVLANLAFFHRPGVALVGGVGMGAVVALLARRRGRALLARGDDRATPRRAGTA